METTAKSNRSVYTLFKVLCFISIVGAINWGLIGVFDWNLVDAVLGGGAHEATSAASRVVYALVGVSGLLALLLLFRREADMHARHSA